MKGCTWIVRDEASISVWDTAWILDGKPYIIQPLSVNEIVKVVDLINEHTRLWKEDVIKSTFGEHEAIRILSIPFDNCRSADKVRWCVEQAGEYTIRNEYRLLLRGFLDSESDVYKDMEATRKSLYNCLWKKRHQRK